MKRIVIVIVLLAISIAASAQTALYKKYANRHDLRVYCVEHYPLTGGDTVTVTFFEADNDSVRKVLQRELMDLMPDRPKKNTPEVAPTAKEMAKAEEFLKEASERKHVVSFMTNPVPGDGGHYSVHCPSDRPVVLVFHFYSDKQYHNITSHMLDAEF